MWFCSAGPRSRPLGVSALVLCEKGCRPTTEPLHPEIVLEQHRVCSLSCVASVVRRPFLLVYGWCRWLLPEASGMLCKLWALRFISLLNLHVLNPEPSWLQ
jgi:hypothetical protein